MSACRGQACRKGVGWSRAWLGSLLPHALGHMRCIDGGAGSEEGRAWLGGLWEGLPQEGLEQPGRMESAVPSGQCQPWTRSCSRSPLAHDPHASPSLAQHLPRALCLGLQLSLPRCTHSSHFLPHLFRPPSSRPTAALRSPWIWPRPALTAGACAPVSPSSPGGPPAHLVGGPRQRSFLHPPPGGRLVREWGGWVACLRPEGEPGSVRLGLKCQPAPRGSVTKCPCLFCGDCHPLHMGPGSGPRGQQGGVCQRARGGGGKARGLSTHLPLPDVHALSLGPMESPQGRPWHTQPTCQPAGCVLEDRQNIPWPSTPVLHFCTLFSISPPNGNFFLYVHIFCNEQLL